MSNLRRGLAALLLLALVTLPLQQTWIRPLDIAGAPAWLTAILTSWAAPVILGLAVVAFWRFKARAVSDWWLIAFFVLAALPLIWQLSMLTDLAIGWRYTVFAMLGYWLGRADYIPIEKLDKWRHVTLWLVLGVSGVQLIVWWLGNGGIVDFLGMEPHFAAGDWWRVYGPMSGPNQLGTFIALSAVWLYWRGRLSRRELLLATIILVLTFSRSAFLAMAAGMLVTAFIFAKQAKRRLLIGGLVVGGVIFGTIIINAVPSLREGLVEARRADLRLEILNDTAERFRASTTQEWLIGHGAGTAGPAASVLENGGFIPENWFLQIAYEFGVAGLLAILGFFGALFWWACRRRHQAVAAIILVVVVNSLFLHPLSDNFATALWFYLLLGVSLGQVRQNKVQ